MRIYFGLINFLVGLSGLLAQADNSYPTQPKLVLGIIVKQMRYEYLQRYWDKLGDGGFKRLIREGTQCRNVNYSYSLTQASPAFATIVTGTTPSMHGIIADEWYERLKNNIIGCTEDEEVETVGGNYNQGYHSPKHLITSTFSDELRLAGYFQPKVYSVSLDPKASVLLSGHIANGAFWYDNYTGNWISSTYYYDSLPQWVRDFNDRKFAELYLQRDWDTYYPINTYLESLHDKNIYEKGIKGYNTFPYKLRSLSYINRTKRDFSMLHYTPYGNMLIKDFALNLMVNEELGQDEVTDVLYVCFSATENIGELYGPVSIEMEDAIIRLDKDIEHFLNYIDKQIGKNNTLIFLTSSSGVAHVPQYMEDLNMPGGVFLPQKSLYILKAYLRAVYGDGEWVNYYYNKQIYLNRNLIEDKDVDLVEVQSKTAAFFHQFGTVSNAITSNTFETTYFSSGVQQKMQNSYNQERSGDIMINLKPGWIEKHPERVTEHNSPYSYDTHVPLIFYGWKIPTQTIDDYISPRDVTPTLSMLLHIPYPNGITGMPIPQIVE